MHWRISQNNFILELNRSACNFTNSKVSGSAVRIRHYPVTVSAESHGMDVQRHWRKSREGSHGSTKRKPGDRPCSTTRGGKMHCLLRKSSAMVWIVCLFVASLVLSSVSALAAEQGSLRGTVSDPLGAIVAGATVELLNGTVVVKTTTTDGAGNYAFDVPENARYRYVRLHRHFRARQASRFTLQNQRRRSWT